MNIIPLTHSQRQLQRRLQQQQSPHKRYFGTFSKFENLFLLEYVFILVVVLNTLIISFLSLFQHNIHITRSGYDAERMLRYKSYHGVPPSSSTKKALSSGSAFHQKTTSAKKKSQNIIIEKPPEIVFFSSKHTKSNSSATLDIKCRNDPVWEKDVLWKTAVLEPQICTSSNDIPNSVSNEQTYLQSQFDLLYDTLYSMNADYTPCGAYCIYHLDSAYSYQYGHPIFGWSLHVQERHRVKNGTSTTKVPCWQPFSSAEEDNACVIYYYNDWIGYVEGVENKVRKLPIYEEHSIKDSHVNPQLLKHHMDTYQPKCSLGGEPIDSFYTSYTAPYCSFRSYDGSNSLSIRTLKEDDRKLLEFRKNSKPSEIVHLFDRYQLGINDLYDALPTMSQSFAQLNTTLCNVKDQPEYPLLCVYHRHSKPRRTWVKQQYGPKVPIKGWQYRTLDRCYIPIDDMEHSTTCGRTSTQYEIWSNHMLELQQKKAAEELAMKKESKLPNCDRLPLLLGQNIWDSETDQYDYVPPVDASDSSDGSSVCGPRLLIVGAAKCGTNTLAAMLSYHPRMIINRCHENKEYCDHYHFPASDQIIWENDGLSNAYVADRHNYVAKYAQKLPNTEDYDYVQLPNSTMVVGRGSLTLDHSPTYLHTEIFPNVVNRAKKLLPNAKVVVSLCNPVDRMYTEFHDETLTHFGMSFDKIFMSHGVPVPKDFIELVNYMKYSADICYKNPMFCDELRRDMLRTSVYHESVKSWRNEYGAENVLVLNMEESNVDKMKKITTLMGDYLPENEYPWEILSSIVSNELQSPIVSTTAQTLALDWLRGYFFRHNVALADEIDADWPLRWNQRPTL